MEQQRPGEKRRQFSGLADPQGAGQIIYRTFASQDRGSRSDQQDSVAAAQPVRETERGILCVLSDGMGGLAQGKEVSSTVVDTMVSTFFDSPPEWPPERILLEGCAEAQRKVLRMQEEPRDRGATLAAVLVRDLKCWLLSVGDSRIMLYRGGGLIPLTRDQNRKRRIETQIGLGYLPPEARSDRTIRALSMFIGREEIEAVDRPSRPFTLVPWDRILLMSDGVYEALKAREIAQIMELPAERVTETMIDRVLEKEKNNQDNCTVIMLECVAEW